MRPDVVIIGVGNPYRRDDGVGSAVIHRLRAAGLPGATLAESDGEAGALILLWQRRRLAVLIDAITADPSHPGRIHRLVVPWLQTDHRTATSTHATDPGEAIALAAALGRLPERLVVYAVEAADTGFGTHLSPAVEAAAGLVAEQVTAEARAAVQASGTKDPERPPSGRGQLG
ncbi:hydrogenase maturation protease [Dactylosporangium matsuzakiense]|uniref:Peptidase M52 n=1 Tax=Dactylosporangium matsuzakiense TaxID=53360 RepID=A0A9W6KRW8_9ACTN|nr:hydrogenase maturation protease [Dactylosporangium matsuzakiense]UWZ42340.1 hydrogenase maturation protease [Dactylosporangium matsuzakiense]GLL05285.1 peptidase M52 [Dactylosporangium matsuzakiense]